MWNRAELKEDSRTLLKLNYWPFVLVAFVHSIAVAGGIARNSFNSARNGRDFDFLGHDGYRGYLDFGRFGIFEIFHGGSDLLYALPGIVMAAAMSITFLAFLLYIFVLSPLEVGCKRYMVMSRTVKPQFWEMGFAFQNCYGNIVKTKFLALLYTFLWSLLLVIPGIVKRYEYRMIPYLLAEYPDMAPFEAFRISREMMMGNKWDAFVLDLSFLGWNILSVMTLSIAGILYVWPYQQLTDAALYLSLKKTNPAFGFVKPDIHF